jgi:hypothetical protein
MDRLTRIAVKLLLIVSVAMQPTFAIALSEGCSAGCMAPFLCQGCGHCGVEKLPDSCSCCSGQPVEDVPEQEHACCGHDRADEQPVSPKSVDNSVADSGVAVDLVPSESPCCTSKEAIESSAKKTVVVSTCNCVQAPETPYDPAPRPTSPEIRELVSCELAIATVERTGNQSSVFSNCDDVHAVAMPHFTQIAFCVWRL